MTTHAEGYACSGNCAALSQRLIESGHLAHVRGALTGAEGDRRGLFALADGGTSFLDEVGDKSPRIQAKLRRAVQEGGFRPLGGRDVIRTDLRINPATNRELGTMVERGEYRGDLYFRVNVVGPKRPGLRARAEDIALLADHRGARDLARGDGDAEPLPPAGSRPGASEPAGARRTASSTSRWRNGARSTPTACTCRRRWK